MIIRDIEGLKASFIRRSNISDKHTIGARLHAYDRIKLLNEEEIPNDEEKAYAIFIT